jgi:CubicO group peptidase (beta-lactamase class C family)
VLVVSGGETAHARGYGMANLEHGVPIRPDTVFDIASVSKQFGAMAVALLEAEGRLSLDDDVRKHIPELPDFGRRITIRHLVHHTSGIRDWPGTLGIGGWNFQDVISFEQILRMAYHQRDLNFAPGDVYAYSNTGYNLLAEIVARVSGRSFRQFTGERIFRPLGMADTHFHDDHTEVVPRRAESYRPGPDGRPRHVVNSLTALGSSSLFTTVNDVAKWIANFHGDAPAVGGPAVIARLHEQGVLNSGERIAYAFGQSVGQYRGARTVSHTGSWAGYRSVLTRFPEQGFAVAILANTADMNPAAIANQIADIYLADALGPAPAAGAGRRGGGPAAGTPWRPTTAEFEAYAGVYRSAELQTSYELIVRDGQLIARHFRTGDAMLRPGTSPDVFQGQPFGQVRFARDERGAVVAFTANSDRVRALRFDRVPRR